VISGNNTGLWIGPAPGIQILGNKIGTDVSGSGFVPNDGDGGIALFGTQSAVIQGNLISGNQPTGAAILILDWNFGPFANNLIQGNTITNNNAPAIIVDGVGSGNTFRGNIISGNTAGIDLGWDGPTANDPLDADSGPNDLQNFPTLVSAANGLVPGMTRVQFSVDAAANTAYTLELFASASCSAGQEQGAQSVYLGALSATNGSGQLSGQVDFSAVAVGQSITGTLTDPNGSTSEFSGCATVVTAVPLPVINGVVPSPTAGVGQGITFQGSLMNNTLWEFTDATFAVYSGFTYLSPSSDTTQFVWTAGIPAGLYSVTVKDQVTGGVSAPVSLTLGSQFGTPELVGVFNNTNDVLPAATITAGSSVFIQGNGIYTTGTGACFTQSPTAPVSGPTCAGTLVANINAWSNPAIGIRAEFTVPLLPSGPVYVQIRSGNSDFTAPVSLTVN
jgi:parallel beta-helix repeat protein